MATPLPPRTPGDRREDYARRIADAVAAVYAQAEQAVVATIAAFARRVAAGLMTAQAARLRLTQAVRSAFATAGRRAGDILAAAQLPAPAHQKLLEALTVAGETAAAAASSALDAAIPAAGLPDPRDERHDTRNLTASLTLIQAARKSLDLLGGQGLAGHTDRSGRRWDLTTYADMVTRAAVSNAWDEIHTRGAIRAGIDVVVVATHSTEGSCPRCLPWLGTTLSLTGATPDYPSLAEAKAAGFRHPNCRCYWRPVGSGPLAEAPSTAALEQATAAYRASQRQHALQRRVRVANRQLAAAVTPVARARARRQLAAARAEATAHTRHH